MSMIQVKNLTFSYPSSYDNIFEDVSFQIDTNWKLGVIGRNGKGKTTLLKLLMRQYPYEGSILSSVCFDYFPYPVPDMECLTHEILLGICPDMENWKIRRELSQLDISEDVLWQPYKTLSNGERTKVLLAALFLNQNHFLLIDEPTNHLDTNARMQVASYLSRKKGFILVSHDQSFMDHCVDHILALNRTNIEVQAGNASSYLANFAKQQQFEAEQNRQLQKEIHKMQQAVEQTASWSAQVEKSKRGTTNSGSKLDKGFVGHKAAKMMKRSKVLETRQQQAIHQKQSLLSNVEVATSLKLSPLVYRTEKLVQLRDVTIRYPNRTICESVSFEIHNGDRIVLDGKNGCGKSSLLKLLLGQDIPYTGTLSVGSGLMISYVPQDAGFLQGSLSQFAESSHIDESTFKTILRKMDFDRVQFEKEMQDFSEGQKKKVLLARSLCQQAHLYIWDEPLNYIDIYSRIQLEELILEFCPTMLFVEHDQMFQKKISTMKVVLS